MVPRGDLEDHTIYYTARKPYNLFQRTYASARCTLCGNAADGRCRNKRTCFSCAQDVTAKSVARAPPSHRRQSVRVRSVAGAVELGQVGRVSSPVVTSMMMVVIIIINYIATTARWGRLGRSAPEIMPFSSFRRERFTVCAAVQRACTDGRQAPACASELNSYIVRTHERTWR